MFELTLDGLKDAIKALTEKGQPDGSVEARIVGWSERRKMGRTRHQFVPER